MKVTIDSANLEQNSLDALFSLCPLCGGNTENEYCKRCNFKYEKGKIYFSGNYDLSWGMGVTKKVKKVREHDS